MSKDKDLESIKAGNGLKNSSTSVNKNQSSGTTIEQRSLNSGLRYDTFTINKKKNGGGK